MIAGFALALFLVVLLVILVLLTNPPNRWVQRMSREKKDGTSSYNSDSRE